MPAQALLFLPQPHARPPAVLNELDASTRDIEACGSLLRKLAVSWEART